MVLTNSKLFATMLAVYVKNNFASTSRGAMLIRCVSDGTVIAAVYGNDNYLTDSKARREVELVRGRLGQGQVQELGFGLSPDGSSWALLVRTDSNRFHTAAGKAFHTEMVRIFLEDAVEGAWSNACGTGLPDSGRPVLG
jgi:hypothetical protein